ncbi:fatty acyl-AMP ligase [Sphaerisporangium rubeum]|uniref:Acyl-CoA synthetase (AMP-forming)/AMP-acid ligase II n=1 Tax=Sphaerisporangium rubeum TaxID=321317 RepID=A0A7X0II74_9ACTN|nr:fatty acyl-AMP ligase [Sphaerisporangium rubeum]MBB6475657.1 acyl-CoA synthetase (AMP-forming)/AMP-acid ligase II [Sphaerisporangium rubeum]
MPPGEWTLLAALRALYERVPRRVLLVYVDEAGRDAGSLDVTGLVAETERIRGLLLDHGLRQGDRAVLLYLPSLDFVSAFLGCLAAGVVPVPVAPPNPFRPGYDAEVLSAVVAGSAAAALLTHDDYRSLVTPDSRWPAVPWVSTHPGTAAEAATDEVFGRWYEPADLDEPVFLQYTSGSTGTPKGVVVSHRNIHHELIAIARDLGLGDDTVAVTWVPHFHDLGLVSFLLDTVVGFSSRTYVMSPLTFLRDPALWLEVISRVRATHTAAPNFAFDLVVRKTTPERRARLDLRSLRVVGSSGELIRPGTVSRFLEAFTPSGFPPRAFYPTYGMAEHTLSITMGGSGPLRVDAEAIEKGKAVPLADDDGRPAVAYHACGWVTKPGARLRIVDPRTMEPCGPEEVGEIWVDSVTKARGYWGLPEETEATFRAVVADGDPRRYLRTGDLGFVHDGELFVTGRYKDLIIIRGHNHYPQDIEDSLRDAHPVIRPGGVAAFSVPAPRDEAAGERIVVFAETNGDAPSLEEAAEITRAVRGVVSRDHGVAAEVVLGPRGLVLKTTSGKIRRSACREAYLKGEAAVWPVTPEERDT